MEESSINKDEEKNKKLREEKNVEDKKVMKNLVAEDDKHEGVEDGSVEDGSVEDGSVEDGSVEDGRVEDGRVECGRVEGERVECGRVEGRRVEVGSVEDGRVEGGSVEDGRVEGGSVEGGRVKGASELKVGTTASTRETHKDSQLNTEVVEDLKSKLNELKTEKSEDLKDLGEKEIIEIQSSDEQSWGWKGWKGWGSSVITQAATQVSQFTNQVGDGLMQVLEPVEKEEEETIVIEDPNKEPVKDQQFQSTKDNIISKGPTSTYDDDVTKETVAMGTVIESNKSPWWLSGLSNAVNKTTTVFQQTTKTVVHGSLDVLEVVGKKTYNIITEGDHGLKSVMQRNKERKKLPNLSMVLTEARQICEMRSRLEESELEGKMYLYSYWFDEYQGLLQLEAFELLCRENEIRTRQSYEGLQDAKLVAVKERLGKLNEIYKPCSSEEEDDEEDEDDDSLDFGQMLMEYAAKLPVVLNVQKILQCQEETRKVLEGYEAGKTEDLVAKEVCKEALRCMAHLTALSIQHYHKLAQLLLRSSSTPPISSSLPPSLGSSSSPPSSSLVSSSLSPFTYVSPLETAVIIVGFSKVLRREMAQESNKFVSVLTSLESKKSSEKNIDDEDADSNERKDGGKDGEQDGGKGGGKDGGQDGGQVGGKDVEDYNAEITSIYLEAANSVKFVVRCLQLLMPALQIAILNE